MKAKYLLDSNICVYLLRENNKTKGIRQLFQQKGAENCCISEITVAELLYGAECSNNVMHSKQVISEFCKDLQVIPISNTLETYARQKAILRKKGTIIEDMDLFIGCAAVVNDCILVTENVKHMQRIENIRIENWMEGL